MRVPQPLPLRELRIQAKLTLDQLAFSVGVDASTLSRAERGYRRIPAAVYQRAVDACRDALSQASASASSVRSNP